MCVCTYDDMGPPEMSAIYYTILSFLVKPRKCQQ